MGNREKSLTDIEQIERDLYLNKQSERLKKLTKKHSISIKKLADILDRDRSMIGFYKAGKHPLPHERAKLLSDWLMKNKGIDIVPEYLTGESDFQRKAELWQANEASMNMELEEEYCRYQNRIIELTTFFQVCGFNYESFENSAILDFADVAPRPDDKLENILKGPHCVTKNGRKYYFSEEELNKLVESISENIGFACYKKELKKDI